MNNFSQELDYSLEPDRPAAQAADSTAEKETILAGRKHQPKSGGRRTGLDDKLGERELLKLLATAQDCFDGSLIHSDAAGSPTLIYAVKHMNPEDRKRLYIHCTRLNPLGAGTVAVQSCCEVGAYTCFRFIPFSGERSLRELARENPDYLRQYPLMHNLVCFLSGYSNAQANVSQTYNPLCCLCPDTVFVNTYQGTLRVLPLQTYQGNMPVEVPREADADQADVSTDLYSAAYLSMEAGSDDPDCPGMPQDDPFLQKLLQPFRQSRPSLQEAVDHYRGEAQRAAPRAEPGGFSFRVSDKKEIGRKIRETVEKVHGSELTEKLCRAGQTVLRYLSPEDWESTAQVSGTIRGGEAGPDPLYTDGLNVDARPMGREEDKT